MTDNYSLVFFFSSFFWLSFPVLAEELGSLCPFRPIAWIGWRVFGNFEGFLELLAENLEDTPKLVKLSFGKQNNDKCIIMSLELN